ncbi:MAG TPA: DNA polymerase domain-containing protein [Candidatus Acidoferrum sp.]|nr:DNA polymerase domain-containing protein [Candidatus Acidoferrum sp.]
MKGLRFYLLDIGEEKTPQGSEIWLWGIDNQAKEVLVVDKSFKPYFYVIPKEDTSLDMIRDFLSSSDADVLDLTVVEKKLIGQTVNAVKITCKSTEAVEANARHLSKRGLVKEILGKDLRYSSLYLYDRGLIPCRWHESEVEELKDSEAHVANAYLSRVSPHPTALEDVPKLRILAFSTLAFAEKGSPHASQDPVSIISVATSDGKVQKFCRSDASDRDIITEFADCLMAFDPDIVAGFESNRVGWAYLIERARKSGATLKVSRLGLQPHTSMYGHVSIAGRASLDMLDYANEMPEVKVKSMVNVAAFLGIKLDSTLTDELDMAKMWMSPQDRHLLLSHSEAYAHAILATTESFLEFGIALSSLTDMPLDQVVTAAVGHRVDSYLIKEAYKQGHLIPPRSEQAYERYQGAIVLAPEAGLHENVVTLDFASMYPNLMILYNLSPDTFVRSGEPCDDASCFTIEGLEYRFRKTPPGLYKNALTSLIATRNEIRKKLKTEPLSEAQRRILQERERAVKVITNACYGYAGWTGARWYVREVAESAAAVGRKTITQVIDRCKETGLSVIYADTDAVFVTRDEAKVDSLLRWVSESLHMDIRAEKNYRRVLFTGAKKRYAGLLTDGTLDIVGMEVVRGDWSEIARKVQQKVIELVLHDGSPNNAKEYVMNAVDKLRHGKVTLQDLIIWKSLTKPIEDYKVNAPHVEVARKYLKLARELLPGDKVGYVVTKKGTKLYEKARPYFEVTPDQVDTEYYVSSQVVPAAARILEIFGIRQDELLLGRQRSFV